MYGSERAGLAIAIKAMLEANHNLGRLSCSEALEHVPFYGKHDTRILDAVPEITIRRTLSDHLGEQLVLISEEVGIDSSLTDAHNKLVVFLDPVDGSEALSAFIRGHVADQRVRLRDVFRDQSCRQLWDRRQECPGQRYIAGCASGLTAVKNGQVIFGLVLDLFRQELFLACRDGVFWGRVREVCHALPTVGHKMNLWRRLTFREPGTDDWERFITYIRPADYRANLDIIRLTYSPQDEKELAHADTPGPGRILTQSSLSDSKASYLISNGEKISEWLGWLAFARYTKEGNTPIFKVYEASCNRSLIRGNAVMAPSKHYSVFERGETGLSIINLGKLAWFSNPSQYRGTIFVIHRSNSLVIAKALARGYTEIVP